MTDPILKVDQLVKTFGGITATDHVDFEVMPGEIHAVIGPNGAGKTTFVAQVAGMLRPDSGKIVFNGRDISRMSAPQRSHVGLARSFQITSVFKNFTAQENVALSLQAHAGHSLRFWKRASTGDGAQDAAARRADSRDGNGRIRDHARLHEGPEGPLFHAADRA